MIDPGWIFGATGFAFGAVGLWRNRRMHQLLEAMQQSLADVLRNQTPAQDAAEVRSAGLGLPAASDNVLVQHIRALTARERVIVRLIAEGKSSSEIAQAFGISTGRLAEVVAQIQNKLAHGGADAGIDRG